MPPAYEILLLNTAVPQIQAAQSGDTYVVPRDIAFSAALTLSAGTANGVPYLNASKVLTTGSALTFDGTTLQVSGGATGKVTSKGTTGQTILEAVTTSNIATLESRPDISYSRVTSSAYLLDLATLSNQPILFTVNSAEQMRLTSTGLGIGTSSPQARLEIAQSADNTDGPRLRIANNGNTLSNGQLIGGIDFFNGDDSGEGVGAYIYSYTTDSIGRTVGQDLRFATGGTTERMRLNSSGNLGIGTSSIPGRLTIGGYGSSNQTPDIQITRSSSGTAIQTGPNITFADGTTNNTTTLQVTQGRFGVWNYGAGSWQERLSVDASGNLLLNGTTAGASAVGTLAIFNGTAPTSSVTNGIILYAEDVSSSSELKVRDEAGNVTTLSPHNFSLIPEGPSEDMAWAYYSEKGGKRINVDMLKLARMVEKLTGEKLVYEN